MRIIWFVWERSRGGSPAGHPKARCVQMSYVVRRERGVWQRRFWKRHIRGDEKFAAAVRYCWINPVKHRLVEHPDAWPHSSWHRDGRGDLMCDGGAIVGCAFCAPMFARRLGVAR